MPNNFVAHEAHFLKEVVLCPPQKEYFSVSDKKSHNITELADREKAVLQHQLLTELISKIGVNIIAIDELQGHPNSVFTRDTALVTPKGFVKLRMGIDTRRGEEIWMANFLESKGVPCVGVIEPPGTVEGGDIILAGSVAFVGNSSRTNKEGVTQISKLLSHQGYEVRVSTVPSPFLHIGGAMSVIDSNTTLSVEGIFPNDFFDKFVNISIPNNGFITGNVITLGPQKLLASRDNVAGIEILSRQHFQVYDADLSEFIKGTGGPSCLIMPLSRTST